jgi:hypothetical protein
MVVAGPSGWTVMEGVQRWGGPPWSWSAVIESAPAGSLYFELRSSDPTRPLSCASVVVAPTAPPAIRPHWTGIWLVERAWDRDMEDLYSAWVGRLFLVDPGARAGWRPLHQVLHDAKRNILYGHLGLNEDDERAKVHVIVAPDCADTPFFLRTYFAWKMRLPFAMRRCLRGTAAGGPLCETELRTNMESRWDDTGGVVERFNLFIGLTVASTVHSGTVRTLLSDESSELFPVALGRETVRPGTVFVDPNGHVLVVTQWVPGTETRIGMLLAVDAHPDRTVSHKRFSEANFYFDSIFKTGGFKAFRPVLYERGRFRFATNAEVSADPSYGNLSAEQSELATAADFYRKMNRLLNPTPMDPVQAYRSHMEGMIDLLSERVTAVKVGVEYMAATGWKEIEMPDGGAIFETTGPWEDYSTPARDLRLLVAMDQLAAFPRLVRDDPDMFRMPEGKTLANVLSALQQEWAASSEALTITYTRSDGSPWTLTLAEVMDRMTALEQAYNPNDCPETRWAAPAGSLEASTCNRRASSNQRFKMSTYRVWHTERRRPSAF